MKKIFTLIAVAAMAMSASAQDNYYAIVKNDPNVGTNKSITSVEHITVTFDGDTSWKVGGGSTDGGEVDGITFTKYATTENNGSSIIIAPTQAGKITIYFGGDVATNKSINMTEGENGLTGTTLVNKESIANGNKPTADLAKWKDGISYNLEANKTYTFSVGGTKWRFAGFKFEAGTSNISTVKADAVNAPAYNLAGQKVAESYKGVVIQNGRKLIQK